MNKNIKRQIVMQNYRMLDSEIRKTGVFEYLTKNGVKEYYNCENCVISDKPDCVFCLLPDYDLRLALEKVIKNTAFKKVEMYQTVLLRKAEKCKSKKLKRLSSIIDAILSY